MVESLEKWLRHGPECRKWDLYRIPCSCGLDKALKIQSERIAEKLAAGNQEKA